MNRFKALYMTTKVFSFFSLSPSHRERIPRKISRIEPMNPESVVLLPLPVRRGEGWGEGFIGRARVRGPLLGFLTLCIAFTPLIFLTGCKGAPSINLVGSFFPA